MGKIHSPVPTGQLSFPGFFNDETGKEGEEVGETQPVRIVTIDPPERVDRDCPQCETGYCAVHMGDRARKPARK
jgi:endonuclease YncB( thermonuclease family)